MSWRIFDVKEGWRGQRDTLFQFSSAPHCFASHKDDMSVGVVVVVVAREEGVRYRSPCDSGSPSPVKLNT